MSRPITNQQTSIEIDESVQSALEKEKESRFVTYKVHQLDWFDVESRIKLICNEMVKPVAEIAGQTKAHLDREAVTIMNLGRETERLSDAVFYRSRTQKNIFNVMADEVTEIRAMEARHEVETTAKLMAFERQLKDMSLKLGTQQNQVESF